MPTRSGGSAVSTEIGFDYDPQATQAAIARLSGKCPSPVTKTPVTKTKLSNLLFLADRNHPLRFGRPISGDDYQAAATGPLPEIGRAHV